MIDINFYMKAHDFAQKMLRGETFDRQLVARKFEEFRSRSPVVYNIETTNACNMKCKMCPRTTRMTRSVETMSKEDFARVVAQLRPWSAEEWTRWEAFVLKEYGIGPGEQSENHFFLTIIPRVIQMHGYGDPLLDKNMGAHVKLLTQKGFHSYFSCNPANIDLTHTLEMFENGLSYIKYSIESVDDAKHKEIRGEASNFSQSYEKIVKLLDLRAKHRFKTVIIITMLDLNHTWQQAEFDKLRNAFKGLDVYIYLKSEDQQWYRKDKHGTKSVHWSEICKHPWMTMTVKSNLEVAMCMEDYNNEIVLGNAREESLADIWNGPSYDLFRRQHLDTTPGIKCTEECDMNIVGKYLR